MTSNVVAQAKAIVETCAQSEAAMARASASAMVARSKEKARCMKFGDNQEMKYGGKRKEGRRKENKSACSTFVTVCDHAQ